MKSFLYNYFTTQLTSNSSGLRLDHRSGWEGWEFRRRRLRSRDERSTTTTLTTRPSFRSRPNFRSPSRPPRARCTEGSGGASAERLPWRSKVHNVETDPLEAWSWKALKAPSFGEKQHHSQQLRCSDTIAKEVRLNHQGWVCPNKNRSFCTIDKKFLSPTASFLELKKTGPKLDPIIQPYLP